MEGVINMRADQIIKTLPGCARSRREVREMTIAGVIATCSLRPHSRTEPRSPAGSRAWRRLRLRPAEAARASDPEAGFGS